MARERKVGCRDREGKDSRSWQEDCDMCSSSETTVVV